MELKSLHDYQLEENKMLNRKANLWDKHKTQHEESKKFIKKVEEKVKKVIKKLKK